MSDQKLNQAISLYQQGQLDQAKTVCADILEENAEHPGANRLIAVLLAASGETDAALDRMQDVVHLTPDDLETLLTLGSLQRQAGKSAEAKATLHKALDLHPKAAAAHSNLANLLLALGQADEAIERFRVALQYQPEFPDALYNLGIALMKKGDYDEAAENLTRCLSITPADAEAAYNLGLILTARRDRNAVNAYQQAIHYRPQYHEAHFALALSLSRSQQHNAMRKHFRAACELSPSEPLYRIGFANALRQLPPEGEDWELRQDLLRLFTADDLNLEHLFRPSLAVLKASKDFSLLTESGEPIDIDQMPIAELLAELCDPLMLAILKNCLVADAGLEQLLKACRRKVLLWVDGNTPNKELIPNLTRFLEALAYQVDTNEYLWAASKDETEAVKKLTMQSAANDAWMVLLAACYRPLTELAESVLADIAAMPDCAALYQLQITDPAERSLLAEKTPVLDEIVDVVSQKVRAQYESHPYPRWRTASRLMGRGFLEKIRSLFPLIDPAGLPDPQQPEILIAGCGTGRHSLETAAMYANSRVLAVDLSLASLAYARQMSERLGQTSIDYLQADILDLGKLDRQFDLIESSGVLHHMADPLAGWRVLTGLLKEDGLMHIGLYSELGRSYVVSAREFLHDPQFLTTDAMRECREKILALPLDHAASKIINSNDFFALSACRDLLFHVQEHRFSLPAIGEHIEELGLEFIGFDLDIEQAASLYLERFPDDPEMKKLANWNEIERDHPDLFAGMYEFWLRKR